MKQDKLETAQKLNSPRALTKELHVQILQRLRVALALLQASPQASAGIKNVRVRNWLFGYEEKALVADIILDKGYDAPPVDGVQPPSLPNTSISFDECLEIHTFVMETDALDPIDDNVEVRFGTPGSEPTLYDRCDYEAARGDMVRLETWQPVDGRVKFTMTLVDIFDRSGHIMALLAEGSKQFEIPLDNVKTAFVLPFHPASISMKRSKKKASKTI